MTTQTYGPHGGQGCPTSLPAIVEPTATATEPRPMDPERLARLREAVTSDVLDHSTYEVTRDGAVSWTEVLRELLADRDYQAQRADEAEAETADFPALFSVRAAMREAGVPDWEMGKGVSSADAIRFLAKQRDEALAQAEIGRQWHEDSSLERWFPLTAERVKEAETEIAQLRALIAELDLNAVTRRLERDVARDACDKHARRAEAAEAEVQRLRSRVRVDVEKAGIYIASKSKHGPRWRALRETGVPICSTWIDESEEGATADWGDLWARCISEASGARAFVMYVEPGETHKGSMVELGAALHAGVPVYWVGPEVGSAPRSRGVVVCESIEDALLDILEEMARMESPEPELSSTE